MIIFCGDWLPVNDISPLPDKFEEARLIVNLECALLYESVKTAKAYPVYIEESNLSNIKKLNPAAVMLANNHVYDCGEKAFEKLLKALDEYNIEYYGVEGKPHFEIMLGTKHCAVIGCLEICRSRGKVIFKEEAVESYIREIRDDYDYVLITPHWGKEGEYTGYPAPRQLKLARKWIAAGADGIFGTHSHVFQGMEVINGKPVYYSLGNFNFPHEEGRNFAMTDRSLCVEIGEAAGKIKTDNIFLENIDIELKVVDNEEKNFLSGHFERLSEKLKNWSLWQWAKHVGPVYISKSDKSWKLRFKKNFVKTFPKWLVWNLLPKTFFMRLGKFCSNTNAEG